MPAAGAEYHPLAAGRTARVVARGRPAARAYAIANALEGMSRAAAAGAAGMERQALRDAVVRYNGEGENGGDKLDHGSGGIIPTAGAE